ncbi:ANTAR domain-containing protein [Streptomyces parvulus]|uniref:ANTAR domain-containing protein n=1 Tax=Streptomyces parvulus TaxID=146923 RepID=UPI0036C6E6BD
MAVSAQQVEEAQAPRVHELHVAHVQIDALDAGRQRGQRLGQDLRAPVDQLPARDEQPARGVLMALHSCTSDEAWEILREASQLSNSKLRDVAAAVTAGTETDGPPPPREVRSALRAALARLGH